MMADGPFNYVIELIVEFYWQVIENISHERHTALRVALDERVLVSEWH